VSDDESPVLVDWLQPEIAVVRLNRPHRLNALTPDMVDLFDATLRDLSANVDCRVVVVVTGTGRGFCAGLDLGDMVEQDRIDESIGHVLRTQERFAAIVRATRGLRQPVIAAVNGAAAGAGLALVLGCDIRLAAESAAFYVAAVKIGLSAGECGISYHLPRLVGSSRAFEIMLTGRPVRAEEALRIAWSPTWPPTARCSTRRSGSAAPSWPTARSVRA
jgi:enoyl-CoA hydratase